MTSDLLDVTRSIYGLVLASDQASTIAPQSDDEKAPAKDKAGNDGGPEEAKKSGTEETAKGGEAGKSGEKGANKPPAPPKPVHVDPAGIEDRAVALPLPAARYQSLAAGQDSTFYFPRAT